MQADSPVTATRRPRVSVVMAVKNQADYVADAIASVLAQDTDDWELVFVDDHSSDPTGDIARQFAAADSRIRVSVNPGRGKVAAFNSGLKSAGGDYIHLLAGDDELAPACLRECLVCCQETKADVVYHDNIFMDSRGRRTGKRANGSELAELNLDDCARRMIVIGGGFYFFARRFVELLWPQPEEWLAEDLALALAFKHGGKVAYLPLPLYHYRQHPGQSLGAEYDFSASLYVKRAVNLGQALADLLRRSSLGQALSEEALSAVESRIELGARLSGEKRFDQSFLCSRNLVWRDKVALTLIRWTPSLWPFVWRAVRKAPKTTPICVSPCP